MRKYLELLQEICIMYGDIEEQTILYYREDYLQPHVTNGHIDSKKLELLDELIKVL